MNKLYKIIAATLVMTMIFAVPVLADEDRSETTISAESTDQLVTELDAFNAKVMGQVLYVGGFNSFAAPYGSHAMLVAKQVKDYDILCCDNHKLYLKSVLSAATTDLENKQAQYLSVASQADACPTYAAMLPEVQAQLVAAQLKVLDAQNKLALAEQKLAKYYTANVY